MKPLLSPIHLKTEQFEDILVYFSKSLLGKENEEEILWDLAKNCIAKLGFVDCVVYLIDPDENLLIQKAAYGPKNPKDHNLYNPVAIEMGEGITGTVAQSGQAEIIPNTSKDSRYIVDDDQRLSEICVPIAHEDVIYGVIDCEHPEKGFFTQHHLKTLSVIASICAIKIKSVRANEALKEKQENLLQIKEEMMELKLKALSSQLNPHFVFNALNAIQYYVTTQDKKATLDYISTFSKLIRFHLTHLEEEVVDLKDELQMLEWFLKLQKLRYEDQFEYTLLVDSQHVQWDAMIPSFVIQPLLESTIENGMSGPQPKEKLHIIIKISENTVVLEILFEGTGALSEEKISYLNQMAQWQNQIRLLNSAKNYDIKKEVQETKTGQSKIILKLPNLQYF